MSIKDHALLVSLYVGKPQLTKKDDKATHDAELANDAHGAGHYRKELYPKHLIAPIVATESAARAYIEGTTYPWRRGESLLPMARFMPFTERIGQFEIQFSQSVTAFLNNWSNVMTEAKVRQGALFEQGIYPDLSELRSQFIFRVSYTPVTDINDFRVGAQQEELDMLREAVTRDVDDATTNMMREPLERLRKAIDRIASVTGQERKVINKRTGVEESKGVIFRDSLVNNLVEEINLLNDFADLLPDGIKNIAAVAMDTCAPHPDALRVDPDLRARTNTNAKNLLAAIEEMMQ